MRLILHAMCRNPQNTIPKTLLISEPIELSDPEQLMSLVISRCCATSWVFNPSLNGLVRDAKPIKSVKRRNLLENVGDAGGVAMQNPQLATLKLWAGGFEHREECRELGWRCLSKTRSENCDYFEGPG